jgi:MYXO-CTERM domain-containing protein
MYRTIMTIAIIIGISATSQQALCDVQVFFDATDWENAVDDFTFIGFTEYPQGTILADQYADLGIHFTENNPTVLESGNDVFEDGHGIWFDGSSGFDNIWVEFDEPITAIAVDFPGAVQFEFFHNGNSVYLSNPYDDDGGGFVGFVSEDSFDSARVFDPLGVTAIDNLYFAPPIPAPGALGVVGIAALCFHRRRRR